MSKIIDVKKQILSKLEECGIENASNEADLMITELAEIESYKIISDPGFEILIEKMNKIERAVARRIEREPLAYILENCEFYGLDFYVNENVLIPRPETEIVVDLVLYEAKQNANILDIGTGSGAIAVSLSHNRKDLNISAVDISEKALEIAKKNEISITGHNNIQFIHSDLFTSIDNIKYDLIVTNPPYVSEKEKNKLQPELSFEPENALYSGEDGLNLIKKIINEAPSYLTESGILIIEIGYDQGESIIKYSSNKFNTSILKDYSGFDRIALMRLT